MIPLQRSAARCCFVYGTLMSEEVLQTLLGRLPEMDPRPAYLPPGYSRHPVKGRVFPGVIRHPASRETTTTTTTTTTNNNVRTERVEGILLSGISPEDWTILDWFEDTAYDRCSVPVSLQDPGAATPSDDDDDDDDNDVATEIVDADVYLWTAGTEYLDLESSWDFEEFRTEKLPWYLRSTVRPCREEHDRR